MPCRLASTPAGVETESSRRLGKLGSITSSVTPSAGNRAETLNGACVCATVALVSTTTALAAATSPPRTCEASRLLCRRGDAGDGGLRALVGDRQIPLRGVDADDIGIRLARLARRHCRQRRATTVELGVIRQDNV